MTTPCVTILHVDSVMQRALALAIFSLDAENDTENSLHSLASSTSSERAVTLRGEHTCLLASIIRSVDVRRRSIIYRLSVVNSQQQREEHS